jgi:hypothetical protein
VGAVQAGLNFALGHAGLKERYIALASDDQIASFVFADPEAFIPLAEKYGLPLSKDAAEAMRQGKEYEQRVREQLK